MSSYFARLDAKARNLGRMMECCGVDPTRLAGEQFGQIMASVARSCIACPHGGACERWLAEAKTDGTATPPAFCPNAGRFRLRRLH